MKPRQLLLSDLRHLQGPQLSILFAMLLAGQPVSTAWLTVVTGYPLPVVVVALGSLREYDFIRYNRSTFWKLNLTIDFPNLPRPTEPTNEP